MSSTIHNMDAATLFVGDDDPTNSLHLVLKNIKRPSFEETTKEHTGGGALGGIELGMRTMKPLMMSFQLEGLNTAVDARFMPAAPGRIKYTMRANVRDIRDHRDIEFRAIIEGRMVKAESSAFEREKGIDSDYEVKEIFFYQEFFDGREEVYYNVLAGIGGYRRNGTVVNQTAARNLGLE